MKLLRLCLIRKNSKDATEGKDIKDVTECDEDNYPTYDVVHWVFNKQTYSKEEFSEEYNENCKELCRW